MSVPSYVWAPPCLLVAFFGYVVLTYQANRRQCERIAKINPSLSSEECMDLVQRYGADRVMALASTARPD